MARCVQECPKLNNQDIEKFFESLPASCAKNMEEVRCGLHKFAKKRYKDFAGHHINEVDPKDWAEDIAASLFMGGPDKSYGRLFLAPAGEKQGTLLLGEMDKKTVKSLKKSHAHELDAFWGFQLQPKLQRCPTAVAWSIWKTAMVWALSAYHHAGVELVGDSRQIQPSRISQSSGIPWEVLSGDCVADEMGCVQSAPPVPDSTVSCKFRLTEGHEGSGRLLRVL